MEIAEVRALIESGIPGCEVRVEGEGCNFSVVVIGDAFEGLNPVKRQQQVLATVTEPLSTGALHAISMKVYTPAEWSRLADSA
ncbi:BolA family protein [Methylococcus geothermalis]|uniref:BolA/IbaG family iron-sulfur metabolism protein n=1 Tax=Methylococcus geothermalis TaxID=2681310 RepID=A0A858Q5W4_9GAMM|nr:BolA family protein [Methylococcus geothermalis]QJD29217.1 BolA/IbaG family iron-sulfur metabolism protein [Methylococcus geothermalis]